MEPLYQDNLPSPDLKRNDKKARILIWTLSIVVFTAVAVLSKVKLDVKPGFQSHTSLQQ